MPKLYTMAPVGIHNIYSNETAGEEQSVDQNASHTLRTTAVQSLFLFEIHEQEQCLIGINST